MVGARIDQMLDKSLLKTVHPHTFVEGLGENYSKDPLQIYAFSVKQQWLGRLIKGYAF